MTELEKTAGKFEPSIPDAIAAATAGAVTVTGAYYWGFFFNLGASLLATLSLQDFLTGGILSLIPMGAALATGAIISELSDRADGVSGSQQSPTKRTRWQRLMLIERLFPPFWFSLYPSHLAQIDQGQKALSILIAGTILAGGLTIFGIGLSIFSDFAVVIIVLGVALGWATVTYYYSENMVVIAVVLSMCVGAFAFAIGRVNYSLEIRRSSYDNGDVVILNSGGYYEGRVILTTANGVFLTTPTSGSTQYFPISNVKLVRHNAPGGSTK